MKRIGIMGGMFFALALSSCDLLKTKEDMNPASKLEMSSDRDNKNPDRD
jgi:hypothetical protein